MSGLLYLANRLCRFLPPTRLYALKAQLLRIAGLDVHPSARIVSSAQIWGTCRVAIGRGTFVGHDVLITGGESRIRIGSAVDIGPRVCIVSGTHQVDMVGERSAGEGVSKDITIEDGVWVGAGVTILGGVTVGRKSVIAAGSLVNESVPPFVMAAGVPCRPVKRWNPQSNSWDTMAHHKDGAKAHYALDEDQN